jgi:hypothetical protein
VENGAREAEQARRQRTTGNAYRYTDRFIRTWTIVLVGVLIVFPVVGIILLASSDSPDPQPVGLALLIVGVAGPILTGAVLGGNAIARGGGWVGLAFTLGFAGLVAGMVGSGSDPALWTPIAIAGGVVLALSCVGFFVIGYRSGVPMWLQAPFFGSPRLVLTRGAGTPRDGSAPHGRHSSDDEQAGSPTTSASETDGDHPR